MFCSSRLADLDVALHWVRSKTPSLKILFCKPHTETMLVGPALQAAVHCLLSIHFCAHSAFLDGIQSIVSMSGARNSAQCLVLAESANRHLVARWCRSHTFEALSIAGCPVGFHLVCRFPALQSWLRHCCRPVQLSGKAHSLASEAALVEGGRHVVGIEAGAP